MSDEPIQESESHGQEEALAPALTREAIATAALSLVDVPFKHQGRDETIGLDCAGVLVATFRKLGVDLRELPVNYRKLPAESHVCECLAMNFQQCNVDSEDLETISASLLVPLGTVLHLKFKRDTEARHLAIVATVSLTETMIVHGLRSKRRIVLEPLRGLLTTASIVGIYQWPRLQS